MDPGGIDGVNCLEARNERWDYWAGQLVDQLAEDGVFLGRAADNGERPDRTGAMKDALDAKDGEVVGQAVVAKVIAKRTLGERAARVEGPADTEIRLRVEGQNVIASYFAVNPGRIIGNLYMRPRKMLVGDQRN